MERVLDVYEKPYDSAYPVVCMDESPKQILDYAVNTATNGKEQQDSEYTRLGVAELFVAFEPLAGYRHMSVEQDHKSATWVKYIAHQMDTQYKDATLVTWVMDNFTTHRIEQFYNYFTPEIASAYLKKMNIVYTPKHGSWLNMAEIQFSIITRQAFDRPFKNKEQLNLVIQDWVNKQNIAKKGANWQFTTKDARIKLASLYPTL
jgi:transposase